MESNPLTPLIIKEDEVVYYRKTKPWRNTIVVTSLSLVLAGAALAVFVVLWLVPNLNLPISRDRALPYKFPLIDGHNDVPWQYRRLSNGAVEEVDFKNMTRWQTDIIRLRKGEVGAQFWSVFVSCAYQGKDAVRATLEQIDVVHKINRRYPETFALALSPSDIRKNFEDKKISSLIGIEGAHQIDASLGALRMMYNIGARYMTLTHNCNNEFADAASNGCSENVDCRNGACVNLVCTVAQTGGITPFGIDLILEMNRLGMLVDISHVSDIAMRRVLAVTKAPVIFSHSSAFALCNHIRNVPDDVLLKLKENKGIVMIAFLSNFISCSDSSTISQVVDHIDYIAYGKCPNWKPNCNPGNTFPGIGTDYIGFGSDFDGADFFPEGLKDVADFVNLIAALVERGYNEDQVDNIIGGNLLRVFDDVVAVADSSKDQFPYEEVLFPSRQCRSNE